MADPKKPKPPVGGPSAAKGVAAQQNDQTPPENEGPKPVSDAPRFRVQGLSHRKPSRFRWRPDRAQREALAHSLELPEIARLEISGEITPEGRADFRLTASLKADVSQACVITLAPVAAQIDEEVLRRYIADWAEPDGEEIEIPEDDSAEPMPEVIDIADVTREALALALPPYPRAPGASLEQATFAGEGVTPLADEDLRPFAGLAGLMGRLDPAKGNDEPESGS